MSPYGENIPRLAAIRFNLVPKPADDCIDSIVSDTFFDLHVFWIQVRNKLIAAANLALTIKKIGEQTKFELRHVVGGAGMLTR